MLERVGTTTEALPTWLSAPLRYSRTAWQRLQTSDTVESCVIVRKVPHAGQEADLAVMSVAPVRSDRGGRFEFRDRAAFDAPDSDVFRAEQFAEVLLPIPALPGPAAAEAEGGDAMF